MFTISYTGSYVLSIRDYDQTKGDCVKHYKMRNMDDGGVYIAARRPFKTIMELVDHYKGWNFYIVLTSSFNPYPAGTKSDLSLPIV